MVFLEILMHQLLEICLEIIAEILKKLPLDNVPNFPEKKFIALMVKYYNCPQMQSGCIQWSHK